MRKHNNKNFSDTCLSQQIHGIHLSDEQKRILLSLRKLYLQNLGILVRRRQDLSSMLQVRLSGPANRASVEHQNLGETHGRVQKIDE